MAHIKVEIETDTDTFEVSENIFSRLDRTESSDYRIAFDVAVQRARKVLEAVT